MASFQVFCGLKPEGRLFYYIAELYLLDFYFQNEIKLHPQRSIENFIFPQNCTQIR